MLPASGLQKISYDLCQMQISRSKTRGFRQKSFTPRGGRNILSPHTNVEKSANTYPSHTAEGLPSFTISMDFTSFVFAVPPYSLREDSYGYITERKRSAEVARTGGYTRTHLFTGLNQVQKFASWTAGGYLISHASAQDKRNLCSPSLKEEKGR